MYTYIHILIYTYAYTRTHKHTHVRVHNDDFASAASLPMSRALGVSPFRRPRSIVEGSGFGA